MIKPFNLNMLDQDTGERAVPDSNSGRAAAVTTGDVHVAHRAGVIGEEVEADGTGIAAAEWPRYCLFDR